MNIQFYSLFRPMLNSKGTILQKINITNELSYITIPNATTAMLFDLTLSLHVFVT